MLNISYGIFRIFRIETVINTTRVMGIRVTISCRYCIAFEVMLFVSSYFRPAVLLSLFTAVIGAHLQGRSRIFLPKRRKLRPVLPGRERVGFLGEDSQPLAHQFRGLESAVCSPAWSKTEPQPPNGFYTFSVFRVSTPGSLYCLLLLVNEKNFPYA